MRRATVSILFAVAVATGCGGEDRAAEPDSPWRTLAAAPLSARSGHSAVWTGERLVVWGGSVLDSSRGPDDGRRPAGSSFDPKTGETTPLVSESYADGAAYDPESDRWQPLPAAPLAPRQGHVAVWTGEEMLVWGGSDFFTVFVDGAAYDPRTGDWRRLPAPPFRRSPAWTAVWTGRELILWGGFDHQPQLRPIGAAYDAAADRWRTIAPAPLPARQWHSAVWTGDEMIVWGGTDLVRSPDFADGAAYDPESDRWRVLPRAPIAGRYRHEGVWTGGEMVVWGGQVGPVDADDGAAYDPDRDAWRTLAPSPLRGRHWPSLVWTGDAVVVWGGYAFAPQANVGKAFGDGAAYDPELDAWRRLPAAPLSGRCGHAAALAGDELIVWGGTEACGSVGHQRADGAALRIRAP
jgi:N-acetylneuraminic acid mutarotase